jgi:hypothetical protein
MLGFAPLASAPLGDDVTIVLLGDSITTGQPTIPGVTLSQDQTFNADPIVAGVPLVGAGDLNQNHSLSGVSILTGAAFADQSLLSQVHTLTAANITTGFPVVGQILFDPGFGRSSLISSGSKNSASIVGRDQNRAA